MEVITELRAGIAGIEINATLSNEAVAFHGETPSIISHVLYTHFGENNVVAVTKCTLSIMLDWKLAQIHLSHCSNAGCLNLLESTWGFQTRGETSPAPW